MFIPTQFKNTDINEVRDFIRNNGFGILVSHTGQRLWGTHLPLELSADGQYLNGHVSKGNQQWKNFSNDAEVMAVFTGPHTYISSSWYDHENVPTWNYVAVHVYGTVRLIEGDELFESLSALVDRYEEASKNPVSLKTMSTEYVHKAMQGLVGFEMRISNIEAAYKLSQNRNEKNYHNIVAQLEKGDANAQGVAQEMKKKKPSH